MRKHLLLIIVFLTGCSETQPTFSETTFEHKSKQYEVLVERYFDKIIEIDESRLSLNSPIDSFLAWSYYMYKLDFEKAAEMSLESKSFIDTYKKHANRIGEDEYKKQVNRRKWKLCCVVRYGKHAMVYIDSNNEFGKYSYVGFKEIDGQYFQTNELIGLESQAFYYGVINLTN